MPVRTGERIAALDIVRGFAVLGILLANITAFSSPELAYYWPPALPGGAAPADGWIWLAQFTVIDGKLRGLFTVLFGAGMVLFVERASAGSRGHALQLRRLGWLLLIGLAHFYLLFTGDVLFSYAASGLLAIIALEWRAPNLLVAGIFAALAGALLLTSQFVPPALIEMKALAGGAVPAEWPGLQRYWAGQLASDYTKSAAMAGPSLPELLRFRWQEESSRLLGAVSYMFLETIPLILIGMGLFRAGVFSDDAVRRAVRPFAIVGVVLGLALNLTVGLYVLRAEFPPYLTQLAFFGLLPLVNLPLLLGGAVLLTDAAHRARAGWLGERLGLAGRMALSNYVGTSLVMALIFQGWAGARFGTMHRPELLLVVAMGWAAMLTCSRLWLARYRQGPLEYIWRCLTYWRVFPNQL